MWVLALLGTSLVQANVSSLSLCGPEQPGWSPEGQVPKYSSGWGLPSSEAGSLSGLTIECVVLGYFPFLHGTGLCGFSRPAESSFKRFPLGIVPVACQRGGRALLLFPKPKFCLCRCTPLLPPLAVGALKINPASLGSLIFQHRWLSLSRLPSGQMSESPILQGPATWAQISSQVGEGRLFFSRNKEYGTSFPGHSYRSISCSLSEIDPSDSLLSGPLRPFCRTRVLSSPSHRHQSRWASQVGFVTQNLLFPCYKVVWVPPVDWITIDPHCLMICGLPFPSLLLWFGDFYMFLGPLASRNYTTAPFFWLPNHAVKLGKLAHSLHIFSYPCFMLHAHNISD